MRTQALESNRKEVKNGFTFLGMEKDSDLERVANLRLVQLLAIAPPGATATGTVEKSETFIRANVAVHSSFRSFEAQSMSTNGHAAVKRALDRLEDHLYRWRFGSVNGASGTASSRKSPSGSQMWGSKLLGSR